MWLAIVGGLLVVGCGRLLQPPTPTAVAELPATPTDTPRPTVTRRATFTPVPATPSDTPTPTATPTPIIYKVQQGDTLLALSRRFGVTVREIQDTNGIDDPRRLRVGQELIIPPAEAGDEPTEIPMPTPVPLRIQGVGFYRTPAGSLWCLGEVVNLSGEPAQDIQVQVSLHDAQGQLLAQGGAFTQLDILATGGKSPFAILFTSPPTSFAQYQTQVVRGVRSTHLGPRYLQLVVAEEFGGASGEGTYQVRGRVRNSGNADAERVAVIVTLYDAEDHVVAARTVGIDAEVFLAGAEAPFDVTLVPLGPVVRHSVEVQGWRTGYPPPVTTGTP